jgi:hypothetical protein
MPKIDGREVISRADMAARGVPRPTSSKWYQERESSGHPERAGRIGREDYWFEDEWTAWHAAYLEAKRAKLTEVDRSGDPDEPVDAGEAAKIMRYKDGNVIHGNVRLGFFPTPDFDNPPRWKRSTVWTFADQRTGPGGGRPKGTPNPPKPAGWHPYQDGAGAKRLAEVRALLETGHAPAAAALAHAWGVSTRTAERIVKAARDLHDQQVTNQ